MERRYAIRFQELMDEAIVPPQQLDGLLRRLDEFVMPFAKSLSRVEHPDIYFTAHLVTAFWPR